MRGLLALLFITCLSGLTAQNLVENPSLEATQCPIYSPNPSEYITPWTTYFGTPNYFEPNCGNAGSAATTNNSQPFDGQGFIGLEVYGQAGAQYNRDYIHGELKEPLVAGKFYRVSFFAKPVFLPGGGSYAIDNLGMVLSDTIIDTIPANNVLELQADISATDPIINTSFWTPVCGVYKAKGGERFITIGNFSIDQETAITPLSGSTNPTQGYYLIDFVEVVENDFPELPADTIICSLQDRIDIDIREIDFSYLWQDGTTSGSYLITRPGTYWVQISSPACSYIDTLEVVAVECEECKVFVPTAFTPNKDGKNDIFQLSANCELVNYHFQVFDRWGKKHFESRDIDVSWDGLNVDKSGTFTYSLEYEYNQKRITETKTRRGIINLIK